MAATTTQIRRIALGLVMAIACSSVVFAQDKRDVRLANEVSRTLRQYPQLTIFDDVGGRVEAGVVTLEGKVTAPYKRSDIERQVKRIDGVRELKSTIQVLPVSQFDDQIRSRVARAIYGSPSFWNYAAMSQPPIHIIVENGHVTLTGVVSTDVDRMLARSLATGQGELSVKNELRTDAEVKSY